MKLSDIYKNNSKKKEKNKFKIKTLKHQQEFLEATHPLVLDTAGFGAGKTECSVYKAISYMYKFGLKIKREQKQQYMIGLFQRNYGDIRDIYVPRFEQILQDLKLKYKYKSQAKCIEVPSLNTTFYFRSMDNPSSIVGVQYHDAFIDELDTLKADKAKLAFQKIRERVRLRKGFFTDEHGKKHKIKNTINITTTPEGFGFCYQLDKKMIEEKNPNYLRIKGSTYDNPYISDEYIENIMLGKPKSLMAQFLNGEFVNIEGQVVYSDFSMEHNLSNEKITKDDEYLFIGMDFNVGKMSAVIFVVRDDTVHAVDEIFGLLDTKAMILEIKRRYKDYKICIYPDSSGKNRKSVGASETDISLLEEEFDVYYPSVNPRVKDRVMTVNSMFCNMKEDRRLFINENKCPTLIDNLNSQTWNEKGEPDKSNDNDHMLDAMGYFIHYEFKNEEDSFTVDDVEIPG